jgi:WD40 repeat protein
MYQQGKTTLWRPPDLQLAINWRDQQKPTLTWAERYDPAFERAMVYLRTSEKEYVAEEENKIMLQKRQMKRVKIVAMIVGGAAIISIGFMLFAFIQKIAADNQKKEAVKQKTEADIQRSKAVEQQALAEKRKVIADSSAYAATLSAEEANRQKIKADSSRKIAVLNENKARIQQGIAIVQSDSANKARIRAVASATIAEERRKDALRQRMLSIGKQMSIKSMQVRGQKDLQTLLAYQAYLFNKNNKGVDNDADIYLGLYSVAKQYGNANYKTFKGHTGAINSIAFVPGKREFYTSGTDGKVLKWNLDSKDQNIQVIYSGGEIVEILSVSPDAGWLALGGDNSMIKMIPLKGNSIGYDLKGHTGPIKSLVFSFDGKYLYSASLDGKVLKWDLAARTSKNVSSDQLQINSIDVSSNGNYLAGVSPDGKVLVWNPEKASDNFKIETDGKKIKSVRFKPDANILAVGYTDGNVQLWDVTTHKSSSKMIQAHTSEVNDIRFNNKYSQIATASNDGILKIWDERDLTTPPINIEEGDGFVLVIAFSPDGQMIISGTYGDRGPIDLIGSATLSDILAQDICSAVTRNLSDDEWSTYIGKDVPYERTCTNKEYNIKVNALR